MISNFWDWGERFFPELQVLLRRGGKVTYVSLTASRQAGAVLALLIVVACLSYLGYRVEHFGARGPAPHHALVRADQNNTGLSQQLGAMRDALAEAESRAEAVGEQNDRWKAAIANARKRIVALKATHQQDIALLKRRIGAQNAQQAIALQKAQQRIATLDQGKAAIAAARKGIAALKAAHQEDVALLKQRIGAQNAQQATALQKAQQRIATLDQGKAAIAAARKRIAALEAAHQEDVALLKQRIGAQNAQQAVALERAEQQIAALNNERDHLVKDRDNVKQSLATAQENLNSKGANVTALTTELAKNRNLLRHSDSNQVALQVHIQVLEKALADVKLAAGQFKSQLAMIERKLKNITAERDRLVAQRDQAQRPQMQGKLAGKRLNATAEALAKIGTAENGHATAKDVAALPIVTGHRIEKLLASTGLDVKKLLHDINLTTPRDEGGPFIPLGDAMSASQETRRHKLLEKLIETLPLRAPLNHYFVSSPFGPRIDPINHRRAFHEGVDLAGPWRSHVYSTAPGVVIFAGADDGFGRLVKIDDGHGIVTMFAHLHRIFVVRGQHVPAHFPIGEEGCTGRCTGPHVHYQIEVDGTPVNPARFLGAGGNVVRVGAKQ
ncbi:MAG: peptidoglycan DD-metalloendopeptidase family protein [Stellaceae bacterium]